MGERLVSPMPDWKQWKDKAWSTVNHATQGLEQQVIIAQLRADVAKARAQLDQAFEELGRLVYAEWHETELVNRNDSQFAEALVQINQAEAALAQAERKVDEAMRPSAPRCAECGADLPPDARYCPRCGRPVVPLG